MSDLPRVCEQMFGHKRLVSTFTREQQKQVDIRMALKQWHRFWNTVIRIYAPSIACQQQSNTLQGKLLLPLHPTLFAVANTGSPRSSSTHQMWWGDSGCMYSNQALPLNPCMLSAAWIRLLQHDGGRQLQCHIVGLYKTEQSSGLLVNITWQIGGTFWLLPLSS